MDCAVQETYCTHCVHRNVCMHKKDFLSIINAVFHTQVHSEDSDGKHSMKPIRNFQCLSDIDIRCKFYNPEKATAKGLDIIDL